jgi:hypothetical protein
VKDWSLKEDMRRAVRGDRERAEARRKAEEEGAYVGPAPPAFDLNKPTREWRLPAKPKLEEVEPELVEEPVAEVPVAGVPVAEVPVEPEAELEEPTVEPEPEVAEQASPGFLARLGSLFRR